MFRCPSYPKRTPTHDEHRIRVVTALQSRVPVRSVDAPHDVVASLRQLLPVAQGSVTRRSCELEVDS